jgi:hypothetical protein
MIVRVTSVRVPEENVDATIRFTVDERRHLTAKLPGFRRGLWMLDRANGRELAIQVYESLEAFESGAEQAAAIRARMAEATGGNQILGTEVYELIAEI